MARGFSLLELSIAMGLFLVLASVITLAVVQAASTRAAVRAQRTVAASVDGMLDTLAGASYDSLVGDSFAVPTPCVVGTTGSAATTCLKVGGRTFVVAWSAAPDSSASGDFVDLTATVAVAGGPDVVQTRRVAAPVVGYRSGRGVVRVALGGGSAALGQLASPLLLLNSAGAEVARGKAGSTGIVLLAGAPGACPAADPCHLGLAVGVGRPAEDGVVSLHPRDVLGPAASIVLTAGRLAEATATVFVKASANLALEARSDAGGAPGAPAAGSVCLWGRFSDGVAERAAPLCNTGTDPSTVVVGEFPVGNNTYAIPPATPVAISVDHPDGTCPNAAGMVGHDGTTPWKPMSVCTSWTWGAPAEFGPAAGTLSPFSAASVSLVAGSTGAYKVVWSGATGRPAAGYGSEPTWAKPRQGTGCALDDTCVSFGASYVPEAEECPGAHCFSVANFRPHLIAPATGTNKVPVVSVTSANTNFDVVVGDLDNNPVRVRVKRLPSSGSLQYNGSPVAVGQVLKPTGTAVPATVALRYSRPTPEDSKLHTFELTVDDHPSPGATDSPLHTTYLTLGMRFGVVSWSLTGTPVTAPQGPGAVPISVAVINTEGEKHVGGTVTFATTAPGAVLSAPSAVTDANGVAAITATFATTPAGAQVVTATGAQSGRSGAVAVTVTPSAGSLAVTAVGAGQGGTGASATVVALDKAGAPMARVTTHLVIHDGASGTDPVAELVYPQHAGCITTSSGSCSVPVIVERAARAGAYLLKATSGSFGAEAGLTVAPTPTSVRAVPALAVAQGATTAATLKVLDGAGAPAPGFAVGGVAPAGSGLSVPGGATATDGSGTSTFALVAAGNAPAGRPALVVSVGPLSVSVPVSLSPTAAGLSLNSPSLTIAQGAAVSSWATVTDGAGAAMAGYQVVTSVPAGSPLKVTSRTTSGADGRAAFRVLAPRSAPVGAYVVTVGQGALARTLNVSVTAVPSGLSTTGSARVGVASTVVFTLTDGAGAAMAGRTLSLTAPAGFSFAPATGLTDGAGALSVSVTTTAAPGTYSVPASVEATALTALVVVVS